MLQYIQSLSLRSDYSATVASIFAVRPTLPPVDPLFRVSQHKVIIE